MTTVETQDLSILEALRHNYPANRARRLLLWSMAAAAALWAAYLGLSRTSRFLDIAFLVLIAAGAFAWGYAQQPAAAEPRVRDWLLSALGLDSAPGETA